MHPTIAYDLARGRIADFHADAAADRRALTARGGASTATGRSSAAATQTGSPAPSDPTRLVRRLLARFRPAVLAP